MRERGAGVRTKEQDGGGEGLSALLIVIAIVFRPVRMRGGGEGPTVMNVAEDA